MTSKFSSHNISIQQGAVLIVSLIMLLIMTIIGLSAMQSTVLEEKMAGNYRNSNIAFQAAETALRDSEKDIACNNSSCTTRTAPISGISNFDANCTNGLCAGWSPSVWADATKMGNAVSYGAKTGVIAIPGVASQPDYLIEGKKCMGLGWASWKYCYRITTIGYGGTQNAQRLVQEVYTLP